MRLHSDHEGYQFMPKFSPRHRRAHAAALLLATSALIAPALAYADEGAAATNGAATAAEPAADASTDDAGAPVITVTARHREERLQEVPIAITAISGAELTSKRIERVSEFAIKVPNFSALQQNTRVSGLYIRGLGGNASNDGAEGGVGLIVDNVFFTHVGFSWLDFVDLENIQVVRGPQGTLLGKNTTIGAVIVQTQKPSFDPSLTIQGTYGNRDATQLRVNATGPIIDDVLAYRLTFANSYGGGWITNQYNGEKLLDNHRWSVRGQLLFTPASNISSRLIVEHYESEEYNNFYPPVADVTENLDPNTGQAISTRTSWSSKLKNAFGYTANLDGPNNANLNNQDRLVARTDGVSNEINWDLGGVNLTSVSAWRRLYFRPYNDSDYSPYDIYRAGYDVDVNQYSQEFRLASQSGGSIDWQLGTYYLHEDLRSNLRTIFGSDATSFFLSTSLPSSVLDGLEYDRDGHLHIDSIAGFGQLTWHLAPTFSVTGGLRYTYEKKQVSVDGYSVGGATLSSTLQAYRTALLNNLGGTTGSAGGNYSIDAQVNRGAVSWLVNPAWQVTPDILVYASASYGEKSGAANTSATAAQASLVITKPEKSTDYEAGIKTNWLDGKVTINLNLYNNTIENYQASRVDSANAAFGTYLANVGKVRLRGFELETSFQPVPSLSFNANLARNDAKYLDYDDAPAPVEYQAALGGSNASLSLTGYQVIGAPKWTVQGGIDLDQPIGGGWAITGFVNTSWRSKTALINPRSIYGWQKAYALTNAGLGLRSESGLWQLQIWSKNLTNKRYALAYSAASASAPINEVYGNPRTFGATVTRKF
ncbi:TonB-dependent receptor [Novosphingobium sp. Rr 2-17]|uniref:TonB-dependent receptor n=1 Tax=Novosphingobium sp. Rr 2-17 TaxID=555793 RepID=UPI0002698BFD|nr:TonB-dependent receptor [Novosphingobium sp. Rr 2-17]EIZ78139.1 TonB-dependent receptor [Novosphingobium sp. Rr 2-17]